MKIKFHQITLFFISTLRAGTKRRLEESETASHCFYEVQNMNCKCKKNPFYCYSISNSEKNIFDQTTSIIKHDEKEYFNRIHDSAYFSEPIKNKISRFNHFNEEFQNFVFSSNPCKFKQPITTLNTRNNFFYFSKQDEISEPLKKELNNWTPISIDFDSLNELLDGKQHDSYIQEQNFKNEKDIETVSNSSGSNIGKNEIQKLQNELFEDTTISSYNNAVKFLKTSIKKYLQPTEIQCKTNLNLELIKLKAFIEAYISNNIPNSYSSRHIRRLKNISEAWEIFDKHKTSEIQYWNVFDNSSNVKFINKLKNMLITFDKNSKFCQENYDMFLSEFEPQIYNRSLFFKLHCNIENLTLNQKTLIFYLEAMKLYKYIYDMPELLSVIGLFSFKSCGYITSTIYLINLIAENVGNLREYRTFILCLICKMFEVFNVNMFGFFMLPHYELVCDYDYHDLSFFLWELNGKKRYDIRSRNSVTSTCIIKDKIFIKAIFYTYLYQHLFYIKYSNIEEEDINSFISFVYKAKISEDCVGCLFKDYLNKF